MTDTVVRETKEDAQDTETEVDAPFTRSGPSEPKKGIRLQIIALVVSMMVLYAGVCILFYWMGTRSIAVIHLPPTTGSGTATTVTTTSTNTSVTTVNEPLFAVRTYTTRRAILEGSYIREDLYILANRANLTLEVLVDNIPQSIQAAVADVSYLVLIEHAGGAPRLVTVQCTDGSTTQRLRFHVDKIAPQPDLFTGEIYDVVVPRPPSGGQTGLLRRLRLSFGGGEYDSKIEVRLNGRPQTLVDDANARTRTLTLDPLPPGYGYEPNWDLLGELSLVIRDGAGNEYAFTCTLDAEAPLFELRGASTGLLLPVNDTLKSSIPAFNESIAVRALETGLSIQVLQNPSQSPDISVFTSLYPVNITFTEVTLENESFYAFRVRDAVGNMLVRDGRSVCRVRIDKTPPNVVLSRVDSKTPRNILEASLPPASVVYLPEAVQIRLLTPELESIFYPIWYELTNQDDSYRKTTGNLNNTIVSSVGSYQLRVIDYSGNTISLYFVIAPARPVQVYLASDSTQKRQLMDHSLLIEPFVIAVPAEQSLSDITVTKNGLLQPTLSTRVTTIEGDGKYVVASLTGSFSLTVTIDTVAPNVTVQTMDNSQVQLVPGVDYQMGVPLSLTANESGLVAALRSYSFLAGGRQASTIRLVASVPLVFSAQRSGLKATVFDESKHSVTYTIASHPVFEFIQVKDGATGRLIRPADADTVSSIVLQVRNVSPAGLYYQVNNNDAVPITSGQDVVLTMDGTLSLKVGQGTVSSGDVFEFPPITIISANQPPEVLIGSVVDETIAYPLDYTEKQAFQLSSLSELSTKRLPVLVQADVSVLASSSLFLDVYDESKGQWSDALASGGTSLRVSHPGRYIYRAKRLVTTDSYQYGFISGFVIIAPPRFTYGPSTLLPSATYVSIPRDNDLVVTIPPSSVLGTITAADVTLSYARTLGNGGGVVDIGSSTTSRLVQPVAEEWYEFRLESSVVRRSDDGYLLLWTQRFTVDRTPVTSLTYQVKSKANQVVLNVTDVLTYASSTDTVDLYTDPYFSTAQFNCPVQSNGSLLFASVEGLSSPVPFSRFIRVTCDASSTPEITVSIDAKEVRLPLVVLPSSTLTDRIPITITDQAGNAFVLYVRYTTAPFLQVTFHYTDQGSADGGDYYPSSLPPSNPLVDDSSANTYYQMKLTSISAAVGGPSSMRVDKYSYTANAINVTPTSSQTLPLPLSQPYVFSTNGFYRVLIFSPNSAIELVRYSFYIDRELAYRINAFSSSASIPSVIRTNADLVVYNDEVRQPLRLEYTDPSDPQSTLMAEIGPSQSKTIAKPMTSSNVTITLRVGYGQSSFVEHKRYEEQHTIVFDSAVEVDFKLLDTTNTVVLNPANSRLHAYLGVYPKSGEVFASATDNGSALPLLTSPPRFELRGDGSHTLVITDAAGNMTTFSGIVIDTSRPNVYMALAPPPTNPPTPDILVGSDAVDGSGITMVYAREYVKLVNAETSASENTMSYTIRQRSNATGLYTTEIKTGTIAGGSSVVLDDKLQTALTLPVSGVGTRFQINVRKSNPSSVVEAVFRLWYKPLILISVSASPVSVFNPSNPNPTVFATASDFTITVRDDFADPHELYTDNTTSVTLTDPVRALPVPTKDTSLVANSQTVARYTYSFSAATSLPSGTIQFKDLAGNTAERSFLIFRPLALTCAAKDSTDASTGVDTYVTASGLVKQNTSFFTDVTFDSTTTNVVSPDSSRWPASSTLVTVRRPILFWPAAEDEKRSTSNTVYSYRFKANTIPETNIDPFSIVPEGEPIRLTLAAATDAVTVTTYYFTLRRTIVAQGTAYSYYQHYAFKYQPSVPLTSVFQATPFASGDTLLGLTDTPTISTTDALQSVFLNDTLLPASTTSWSESNLFGSEGTYTLNVVNRFQQSRRLSFRMLRSLPVQLKWGPSVVIPFASSASERAYKTSSANGSLIDPNLAPLPVSAQVHSIRLDASALGSLASTALTYSIEYTDLSFATTTLTPTSLTPSSFASEGKYQLTVAYASVSVVPTLIGSRTPTPFTFVRRFTVDNSVSAQVSVNASIRATPISTSDLKTSSATTPIDVSSASQTPFPLTVTPLLSGELVMVDLFNTPVPTSGTATPWYSATILTSQPLSISDSTTRTSAIVLVRLTDARGNVVQGYLQCNAPV
jgi:hypothetical protein